MKQLFDSSSLKCSKIVTNAYSTSFSLGIKLFAPSIRPHIYAIYGFVRYADEIVDSFEGYNQKELFHDFVEDYKKSLDRKISLNPIINAFQEVVHNYNLHTYADDFLKRMEADLYVTDYTTKEAYENYIYGSADVVGLMCLRVFVNNDEAKFNALKDSARHLGSAFQKVNFLRDIKDDMEQLGRSYFPNLSNNILNNATKEEIIDDINIDLKEAYKGIVQLPLESRFGVYIAYRYYLKLLKKLKKADSEKILSGRIRISNGLKVFILTKSYIRYKLNFF
ncbi:MAG: phytoene synthase [Xanthomarina sp.]|uniref:phytoene/squalene synthase family protein n=1 Tax=Xanthomarina sp. TaxID=1931211 RepID=UPI000C510E42|nr:phytoene/squalene synthase family protein [Xanthomarina sp.]MBF62379.1 phytoene synthase [Xanthomarina sp.]HAB28843.1 phytoene synthase [Xanthomarina gelatinilytica]HAI17029.1 phytoene synthase [Xanthomarina gelatinilytica]|tara:strand:- start:272 stop:1108 length:837 start_codon:yes stop_codon:yes gene_type:complete